MMRNSTDKKKAPIICAVIIILALAVFLACFILPMLKEVAGFGALIMFFVLYGVVILAVIVGVIVALRQRLQEIEGGEEDDARKY